MRIGIGYDIHRRKEGRRLVLGGVEFPGEPGLEAHSDGDVVLHAVADAVLGAAALGDLRGRHLRVRNLDVNVIAERPKIGPKKDQMRANLAAILGVSRDDVSVKARTAEGLGPVGRGEAIEAHAVVLLDESDSKR